jgi:hypothetical protein
MKRNSPEHRELCRKKIEERDRRLMQSGFYGFSNRTLHVIERMGLKNIDELKRVVEDKSILSQPGFGLKCYVEVWSHFNLPMLRNLKTRPKFCPHCSRNIYEL